jgi:hypothetical protein
MQVNVHAAHTRYLQWPLFPTLDRLHVCQHVTTGKDTLHILRMPWKRAQNVQSTGVDDLLEHPNRKMKPEGSVVLAHPALRCSGTL